MDDQLLVPYQESLALLGLWLGVFLGDKDNGNDTPGTFIDSMDALLAFRPSTFEYITVSATEGF